MNGFEAVSGNGSRRKFLRVSPSNTYECGTPGWSRQEIDAVIKSGERKDAKVAKPVPLYWVYVTAWATPDGVSQFREDIYNRDGLGPVAATKRT